MTSNGIIKKGFTLIEMAAVVAILSIIAVIAVSRISDIGYESRIVAAESDLKAIADAFVNDSTGYIRDMKGIPGFSTGYLRIANLLIATNLYGSIETSSGERRGERVDGTWLAGRGCARPEEFTKWNEKRRRGWNGPYLRHSTGEFPFEGDLRNRGDSSFGERGFFPSLANLFLPDDFVTGLYGCSVYGFPGEPAVLDPWGNPYVLQIPPPQAFRGASTNVSADVRFFYARVVSAGPDGVLSTPCFFVNTTNSFSTSWTERNRRLSRQAGLIDGSDRSARGDDLVLFLSRNDTDEGEEK